MCRAGIDPRAGEEVVETFAGTKQMLVTLTAYDDYAPMQ